MTSKPFTKTAVCRSRGHCAACQDPGPSGVAFRLAQIRVGRTGLPADGSVIPCPYGEKPPEETPEERAERELLAAAANPQGLGDHVASLIHKVGADRVWKLIRGGSGCGGCNARREALNRLEEWVKSALSSEPTSRQPPTPPRP